MPDADHEQTLVLAARSGDPAAVEELIRQTMPLAYNVIGRAVGGGPDVDDLVQNTMLRMLTGLPQLREPARFRSWLVTIAMRQVRDRWRDIRSLPEQLSPEDSQEHLLSDHGFEDATVLRLQLRGQRREAALAMAWLDPAHRETAALWWLELAGGLDREELADALGVSPRHASVRVQRMREQLDVARRVVRKLPAGEEAVCASFTSLSAEWDGRPSPLMRKRLFKHIRECEQCVEEDDELLPAKGLLAGLGMTPLPLGLSDPGLPSALSAQLAGYAGSEAGVGAGSTVPLHHSVGTGKILGAVGAVAATAAVVAATVLPTASERTVQPRAASASSALTPPAAQEPTQFASPATTAPQSAPTSPAPRHSPARQELPARVMKPVPVKGPLPQTVRSDYSVPADAIHVSVEGTDKGDGTVARPYRTPAHAFSQAPKGATVVIHQGTYRVGRTPILKPLTVQPAPGAQVWLKGSRVFANWEAQGQKWCTPWKQELPIPSYEEPSDYLLPAYPEASRREMAFLDGSALRQVGRESDIRPGTFAVQSGKGRLCVGDNPAGHTIEATTEAEGLTVWGERAAGTVIRGIGFAHYAETGLRIGAPRVVAESVTTVRNAVTGITVMRGRHDVTIRHSHMSHNGRKGVTAQQASRLVLESNLVSYNNTEGFRTAWDAAGVKITDTAEVTARDNYFLGNFGHALWLDINVNDATVVRNRFVANHQFGGFVEISRDAVLAGNIAANNGTGLAVANSSGIDVLHNTLSGNVTNLLVKENAGREASTVEAQAGATFRTSDIAVSGNLLIAPKTGTTKTGVRVERWPCSADAPMLSALDHNAYIQHPAAEGAHLGTFMPAGDSCRPTRLNSLDDLRKLHFERDGVQASGSSARTAVSMPERGDFSLPAGSPARGGGAALPASTARILDVPAGSSLDIGALSPSAMDRTAPGSAVPNRS
ncbi:sigma-70 family RNA polymerase sigma factor [Streptomyces sp. NPDC056405]|uniref:sigma-70 family RNA polymerase sigma factor n=1 Tax=Streptomyces sp. NPDC056405 TaxID=3345811 RepID=UPI0035DD2B81